MISIREELAGGRGGVPEFRLLLPDGWTMSDVSERTEQELLAAARARLRAAQRPDTYAMLAGHVTEAMRAARQQGAFAMITPGAHTPQWSLVPISILASVREGTPAVSLDQMVADAVENRGARALDGSRHFLRWAQAQTVELSGETAGAYVVVYLTPMPGTRHRKALQLTATLAHPIDVDPTTQPEMRTWLDLLDAHLLTFAWTGK
ncbi:hypothetical protein GCM10022240_15870 [Microbacterium kribbense]|uniref:Uncharacterized protein n=1 Tax=Microbacterium kribbense TaxID=433645 RepID=A0ABP7GGA4_9MICO